MKYSKYPKALLTPTNCARYSGVVDNLNGACYDNRGKLILDSLRDSDFTAVKHVAPSYIRADESFDDFKGDYVYAGHCHGHFGHFLMETIPELFFAKENLASDRIILFHSFIDQDITKLLQISFVTDTLKLFGLELSKICFVQKKMKVDFLFCSPRKCGINNYFLPDSIHAYKSLSSQVIRSTKHGEKIFLSRSQLNSKKDNRGNNLDIDKRMESLGFDVVYPEKLSFYEQISIMKNTRILVGFDGSALHLSLFMKQKGKVIVIGERVNKNTTMCNQLNEHITKKINASDIFLDDILLKFNQIF